MMMMIMMAAMVMMMIIMKKEKKLSIYIKTRAVDVMIMFREIIKKMTRDGKR